MLGFGIAEGLELLTPGILVGEEALGEAAVLNFSEDRLHSLPAFGVDDARAADVVAPFSRVRDAVAHIRKAAAIDQVDDQLELMQHFEVGALRLISGFNQRFVARLDQRADPAAKHSLFAEEVRFCLLLERRFQHSRASAANALEIAESEGMRFARSVLVHGDQSRDPAALSEDFPHAVPGSLGSGKGHVYVLGRNDSFEVNVEAVCEEQQFSGGKVGSDLVRVKL